jgi:PIN domain nuclease of toxin-antitoxin system
VSYLLDTNVWLWMWNEPENLRSEARQIIEDPAHTLHVSAASAWEIATKASAGRLTLPTPVGEWLADPRHLAEVTQLPITFAHASRAGTLPAIHRDPFDRMIVAQAQIEHLTVITADAQVAAYHVEAVRA